MKISHVSCSSILIIALASIGQAKDIFFQSRAERTRCCIPRYDYQTPGVVNVSSVISEAAVVIDQRGLGIAPGSQSAESGRVFIFNDVFAGPLILTGLTAKSDAVGNLLVTGVLIHTGGDTQQLLGGKAVIRIEPLTAATMTLKNPAVLATKEATCWVRKGEPETVLICINKGTFGDVERVRVFLEYRSIR